MCPAVITRNYYAPLASQVEELDKHVTFTLPHNHVDKNSAEWRQQQTSSKKSLQLGVLNGSIPSAIGKTGATSSAFTSLDPSIPAGIKSNKTFGRAFGEQAEATRINKLHHNIQELAQSVHIIPQVQHSLLSTGKMTDADYIRVYTKHEVNFYDAITARIIVTEESVLKGWRCPSTGLWRVPLVKKISNLNTDTLILNHPLKVASSNKVY